MLRASCALALVITLAACGRISYGDIDAGTDAGTDAGFGGEDGGAVATCSPLTESCNDRDDDCDRLVDETFDLATDPSHCGMCTSVCTGASSASAACVGGACILVCADGFADCDGVPDNGCEANLADPSTCGSCTTRCGGATPLCQMTAAGAACVSSCEAGLVLCGARCVNLQSDVESCGACGTTCLLDGTRTACVDGMCAITDCPVGTLDCNTAFSDGCETTGVVSYLDTDGDAFGTGAGMLTCKLAGAAEGGDCDDDNAMVFPGQTMFFATPRAGGSFDYDCNGAEAAEIRVRSLCASGPMCMLINAGWVSVIPTCGMSGTFMDACGGEPPCFTSMAPRTQRCR